MSIYDQLSTALGGAPGESGSSAMLSGVMGILNNHPGGVSGLAQAFEQNGLGHLMASWIGTGENLPVSADQVKSILGNERVAEFAAKAGISPDVATSHLAELLPNVINKLSPDGKLPEGGSDLMSEGMSLLGGLFSKGTQA
ncbi:MAG: YidB family protein [Bryobacteraceae bacterium]